MEELLRKFGLDDREVAIYKSCLQHELNTPSSIARNTGIKRTTVYLSIEKLKEKNLLHSVIKKDKKYFSAISPEIGLKNYIENKKDQISEEELMVEEIKKYLQAHKAKDNQNTKISYFDTNEGIRSVISKIIAVRDDIYWLGNFELLLKVIPDKKLYRSFTQKRLEQATSSYAITDKSITKYKDFYDPKVGFRQYRFFKEAFTMPALLIIFGDHICLASIEDNKAKVVLIEDKTMTNLVSFMFKFLWSNLE